MDWQFCTCFLAARIEVMLELKCAYWMSCSCCYSSEGKVDVPHTVVKVGERGIADCRWLKVGCVDCRM